MSRRCIREDAAAIKTHSPGRGGSGLAQHVFRSPARIPATEPQWEGLCAAPPSEKRSTFKRKTLYVIMRNITLNGGGGCAVSSFIWRARSAGFRARSAKCVPCRLDAAGSLGTAKAAADRIIPTDRSGYQCGQSGAPKILHHIAREPLGVWGQASPWGFIRQKCIAGRATRPPCSNATSHSGG
jgi:hypothetical protein